MLNRRKLSGSGSNKSQPKIFPPGTGSSDSTSALTLENVKRLEKEYRTSKEAFNKQRIQDYIKQTNLALFNKETTRKTSTELVWDTEPEGASSSFPAKQNKNSKDCWKISEEISSKDKLLTAPATDSPPAQPTGSKPKESRLFFQLGRKVKSDSPATVNQRNTTLHTTNAAAATWTYIGRGRSSLFSAVRYKH